MAARDRVWAKPVVNSKSGISRLRGGDGGGKELHYRVKTDIPICFLIKGVPRYPHSVQLTLLLSPTHLAPHKPHKKMTVGVLQKGGWCKACQKVKCYPFTNDKPPTIEPPTKCTSIHTRKKMGGSTHTSKQYHPLGGRKKKQWRANTRTEWVGKETRAGSV